MDKDQLIAARHYNGPAIVVAGPGCGKTSIISNRIKILTDEYNVDQKSIAAISFTRYSSLQLRNRTLELDPSLTGVFYGTFHSYFLKILTFAKAYTFKDVLDGSEKRNIISSILREELKSGYIAPEIIQEMISDISRCSSRMYLGEAEDITFQSPAEKDLFYRVYEKYTWYKDEYKRIDFDDILTKTHSILTKDPSLVQRIKNSKKFYIIDEYQDINKIQFDIIKLLLDRDENLFVVGDDDQSIYSFRGSDPQFLTKFSTYFENSSIYKVTTSYRCPSEILNLTNRLISNNKERVDKQIKHKEAQSSAIRITSYERADEQAKEIADIIKASGKDFSEYMIIYRTNLQVVPFIARFSDMNIPYIVKDSAGDFFENFILKDVLTYFRLSQRFSEDDMNRVRNKPNRFMKKMEIAALENYLVTTDLITRLSIRSLSVGERFRAQKDGDLFRFVRDIEHISELMPSKALDYIKYKIGYDKYLKAYSEKSGISMDFFEEIFENIYSIFNELKTIPDALDYVEKLKNSHKESDSKNQISKSVLLTTVHGAKGLERNDVFVISVNEGIMPHKKSLDNIEEERRIMYVACTRAKENLHISYLRTLKDKKLKRSIFVDELNRGRK